MRPIWHVAAGVCLWAGVCKLVGDWKVGLVCAAAEVMVDFDHVIEHIVRSKYPFSIRAFMSRYNSLDWQRIIFCLHSYELLALIALSSFWIKSTYVWAIFCGILLHLILDEVGNRLPSAPGTISPWFYFFTYRMLHSFRREDLIEPRLKPSGNTV